MVEIEEMAQLGSGTTRQVKSFKLSRTACIAIALNADQRKPIVKAAKDYFTSRMNSQELATSVEGNVLIYRSSTGKVNVNVLFSQDTFVHSNSKNSNSVGQLRWTERFAVYPIPTPSIKVWGFCFWTPCQATWSCCRWWWRRVVALADRVYIYDNSVNGTEVRLIFRMTDGKLFKRYTEDIPIWAQTIIG